MKISIRGFITSKMAEQYSDCADNYAVNMQNHRFSISDGVSKSFFPKEWSEILTNYYVERTDLNDNELILACQNEWQKRIDDKVSSSETKWFTKTQYNRKDPALATFLGLKFNENEKTWDAWALGDTFLFFIPRNFKSYLNDLIIFSSKPTPYIFDNFPDYLSSVGTLHKGRPKTYNRNLRNGEFYLMTDALAEWFIKEGENAINELKSIKSQRDFQLFINKSRSEKKLVNDDCAILCIEISESEEPGIEYVNFLITDIKNLTQIKEIKNEPKTQIQNKNPNDKDNKSKSNTSKIELVLKKGPTRKIIKKIHFQKKYYNPIIKGLKQKKYLLKIVLPIECKSRYKQISTKEFCEIPINKEFSTRQEQKGLKPTNISKKY